MDRVKRIWYLLPMRAAKVQASLRIRAVSPEPPLLAHTSSESRGTFRQKARSLAPLNGWACAVKICNDGMLEDTNSLDGAHISIHDGILILYTLSDIWNLHNYKPCIHDFVISFWYLYLQNVVSENKKNKDNRKIRVMDFSRDRATIHNFIDMSALKLLRLLED